MKEVYYKDVRRPRLFSCPSVHPSALCHAYHSSIVITPDRPYIAPHSYAFGPTAYRVLEVRNGSGVPKQILSGFSRPCLDYRLRHPVSEVDTRETKENMYKEQ